MSTKRTNEEITNEEEEDTRIFSAFPSLSPKKLKEITEMFHEDLERQTNKFVIYTLNNPQFFKESNEYLEEKGKYENEDTRDTLYSEYLKSLPSFPKTDAEFTYESIEEYWNREFEQYDEFDESTIQTLEYFVTLIY